LKKIDQADFLKSSQGKIPISAHVKLQKLLLGAESKLRAIFSTDFISLHQGKKYERNGSGRFFYQRSLLKTYTYMDVRKSNRLPWS